MLGSVTVTDSMENSFVAIALDPSALAYINAGLGGTLGFGGVLTTLGSGNPETLFGFTTGSPASYAQLVLEPVVVPVPAAALLFTSALAAAGLVARRRAPDGALA